VAAAFLRHFGLRELYVADLDAIAGAPPAFAIYEELHALGCALWVDAGLRVAEGAGPLVAAGVGRVVAGLETLAGPQELARLVERHGERVVFSLDLKEGRPLGVGAGWEGTPWEVARRAVETGVRRLLVLDLARVGVGGGTGTEELCRRLVETYPELELATGGGVSGPADLQRLQSVGVRFALVASALHDGCLVRRDLRS
jgi:phosphoribosylformimino-5-aminoimidazole carboxamide ribotide isomerase